jgi:4-hydroxymandelate oxidase
VEKSTVTPNLNSSLSLNTVYEYEQAAKERLSPMAYSYYMSGARDELTLNANRTAWDHIWLYYQVLVNVEKVVSSTQYFNTLQSSPILVAPTAFHGLAHPRGELETAEGSSQAGCVYISSTLANYSLEEISEVSKGTRWFQLYVYRDRGITLDLIKRAEAVGCKALVITVDAATIGTREQDRALRFHLPNHLTLGNFKGQKQGLLGDSDKDSALAQYVQEQLDPSLTWHDLKWLIQQTNLPVIIKGIIRADDAQRAFACGAAGIVVSNHGGRQLDTAPPTAIALPAIVDAVADQGLIFVDGGIRRGTDILKALGMGAHGVLLGRPVLCGLTYNGAQGVASVLNLMKAELEEAMKLCGCPNLQAINKKLLRDS